MGDGFKTKRSAPNVFGTGADGDAVITADTVWTAPTEDTGIIEKNFKSLTINSGVTVSAGNRNAGMIIKVLGDCTISGKLVNRKSCKTLTAAEADAIASKYPGWLVLNGSAGNGGQGNKSNKTSQYPLGMVGRFYGGGISGGGCGGTGIVGGHSHSPQFGGQGGRADLITTLTAIFSGGAAITCSGGTQTGTYFEGNDGDFAGGGSGALIGGSSGTTSTTGAGGNSEGANGGAASITTSGGANISAAGGGAAGVLGGGVIIILCGGTLAISGEIDCSGNDGAVGGRGKSNGSGTAVVGGNSGGGGGGRVYLLYRNAISLVGTVKVAGGTAQSGSGIYTVLATNGTDGDKYKQHYTGRNSLSELPEAI